MNKVYFVVLLKLLVVENIHFTTFYGDFLCIIFHTSFFPFDYGIVTITIWCVFCSTVLILSLLDCVVVDYGSILIHSNSHIVVYSGLYDRYVNTFEGLICLHISSRHRFFYTHLNEYVASLNSIQLFTLNDKSKMFYLFFSFY